MTSLSRYVDITSGVGAGAVVATRDLIARIYTSSLLIPSQEAVVEFTSADDVGAYFGFASTEYKMALAYFGYVSKNITNPKRLGFSACWQAATNARVYGGAVTATLAQFQAITTGQMSVTMGSSTLNLTSINLSSAVSLAGVASLIQAAVRTGPTANFTSAVVTYNATDNRFELVSGATGSAVISIADTSSGTQVAPLLKWREADGARWSYGQNAPASASAYISTKTAVNNNFGSFLFSPDITLSTADITDIATWNDAQNNAFMYSIGASLSAYAAIQAAISTLSGACISIKNPDVVDEYIELMPCATLAATDYSRPGATQNYMYQQYSLTPIDPGDNAADTYDSRRVNYYASTQTAGQQFAFYQRGVLQGSSTDAVDINTYVNEMWLKDHIAAQLMTVLLAMPTVPANEIGQGILTNALQSSIDAGLYNGVISVGKPLTSTQKSYITTLTNDPDAWRQVQNAGYWVTLDIRQVSVNGANEFHAFYTLIYSKDDAVRKVEGSNILI